MPIRDHLDQIYLPYHVPQRALVTPPYAAIGEASRFRFKLECEVGIMKKFLSQIKVRTNVILKGCGGSHLVYSLLKWSTAEASLSQV
jgi:hypothetical protein